MKYVIAKVNTFYKKIIMCVPTSVPIRLVELNEKTIVYLFGIRVVRIYMNTS